MLPAKQGNINVHPLYISNQAESREALQHDLVHDNPALQYIENSSCP